MEGRGVTVGLCWGVCARLVTDSKWGLGLGFPRMKGCISLKSSLWKTSSQSSQT